MSEKAELVYVNKLYSSDMITPTKAYPLHTHYGDVMMTTMASQITSLTVVYSTVYSDADKRKNQSSASLALVRGIHRSVPVNSPHKGPVTRKMFPFHDVIIQSAHQMSVALHWANRAVCVIIFMHWFWDSVNDFQWLTEYKIEWWWG